MSQETLQLFTFLYPLQHMKRPASQNKRGGVLRMAFRVRKVFGTFEKRTPGAVRDPSRAGRLFPALRASSCTALIRGFSQYFCNESASGAVRVI